MDFDSWLFLRLQRQPKKSRIKCSASLYVVECNGPFLKAEEPFLGGWGPGEGAIYVLSMCACKPKREWTAHTAGLHLKLDSTLIVMSEGLC